MGGRICACIRREAARMDDEEALVLIVVDARPVELHAALEHGAGDDVACFDAQSRFLEHLADQASWSVSPSSTPPPGVSQRGRFSRKRVAEQDVSSKGSSSSARTDRR